MYFVIEIIMLYQNENNNTNAKRSKNEPSVFTILMDQSEEEGLGSIDTAETSFFRSHTNTKKSIEYSIGTECRCSSGRECRYSSSGEGYGIHS